MRIKPNKNALMQIMLKRGLSRQDVAKMLCRKDVTVRHWLSGVGSDMPDDALQILKFKIGEER